MTVGIGVYKSLFYASRGTLRRSCTFSVTHCGVLTARFRTVSACVVSLVRDDRRRREGALGTGARFMRPIYPDLRASIVIYRCVMTSRRFLCDVCARSVYCQMLRTGPKFAVRSPDVSAGRRLFARWLRAGISSMRLRLWQRHLTSRSSSHVSRL